MTLTGTITVIGAGIAGLSCAFDLARAGNDVRVFDAAKAPGGMMRTVRRDGFQFEEGPNSIPGSATGFLELCKDAGVTDRLVRSTPSAKTRFLFHRGGLHALPMSPGALLKTPLLSFPSKLKLATESWRRWRPQATEPDPTFDSFVTERFGHQVARRFGASFVRGIYASESTELGTASAFPRLWDMVQQHGGVLRGMKAKRHAQRAQAGTHGTNRVGPNPTDLVSLDGGLGELSNALAASLGDRVSLGTPVESLSAAPSGGWQIRVAGEALESTHVVLAVSAPSAGRLLQGANIEGIDWAPLQAVEHASVTVVSLGFGHDFLPNGFGFLVPPDAQGEGAAPKALGILFVSKMFAGRTPPGACAISAVYRLGDTREPHEPGKHGDDDLVRLVTDDLRIAMPSKVIPGPSTVYVRRWPDAIPRYAPGHRARMDALLGETASRCPGLHLIGNFTAGVSIDDRIRAGRACAQSLAAQSLASATGGAA